MITDPQDRELYHDPRPGPRLADRAENARVRELLAEHLDEQVAALGGTHGAARKQLARDWCALCRQEGILGPGEQQRASGAESEAAALERHADAAHTRIRNFQAGQDVLDWLLAGIEAVICDRKGLALPAAFYHAQERLPGV